MCPLSSPLVNRAPLKICYVIDDRLYLNITDACTLACAFCPKHRDGPLLHGEDLSLPRLPRREEIFASIDKHGSLGEVVFCGFGEPTLRLRVLLDVAQHVKARGGHVRVNTDGLANLVHRRNVLPEMAAHVDALSVSLNAQNKVVYDRHCRPSLPGSYAAVLAFLEEAPRHIPDTAATAVDGLAGVDIEACRKLAEERGVVFRPRLLDRVG